MNLTQLKCFAVVANQESITKAAEILYISQPAVSKTIKQLEDELQVQLFDRTGRTLKLNRAGRLFFSYVNDSLKELDRGVNAVEGGVDNSEQPISILMEVASPFIPSIVTNIKDKFPNVRLSLAQHTVREADFKQFDFIVTSHPLKNLTNVPVLKEEVFVGWNSKFGYSKKFINPKEIKSEKFIGLTKNNPLRNTIDRYFNERGISLNYMYETDDPATIRGLIEAGIGLSFIPSVTWQTINEQVQLARLTPEPLQRTIFLCSPSSNLTDIQREISNELIKLFLSFQRSELKI
ncbi:LysR family transcriptional regulator [Companilactobacillus huachuanensis]|uniref:LysR family transcriptional regulator n=1 Tax=Companilactobacillus huachuanensis TaxID=2559914 RepID=A0ABW1RN92_9LACO|nr:LysR family transcriptional regulator [Companilactobacillus huachuanensis]